MAGFVDRALLQLHQPAALETLLKASSAAPYPRLQRLITAVFGEQGTSIDRVDDISVAAVEPFVRIPITTALRGALTTTQPAYAQTEARAELTGASGCWAHLIAKTLLRVVVQTDGSGIESVVMSSIDDITDLDDFASRFRYLDLPSFLRERRITTVEQLRESAHYLLAEIRLKRPPALDPDDPANSYRVEVDVAVTIVADLDLAAGLQAARELEAAGESRAPGPASDVLGVARRPYATAVVLPQPVASGDPSEAQIDALFAQAGVLPLFANPP